jgi:hypothetical protein
MESYKHVSLTGRIAELFAKKGYSIIKDGERTRASIAKEFKGLCRVDIIAVKGNELLLIECGWIDGWRRLSQIKEEVSKLSLDKRYQVKILWYPYLYSVNPHNWANTSGKDMRNTTWFENVKVQLRCATVKRKTA